ncbi:MAG: GerW family sporulation protein [Clostridia bacterium]|nr:sporulation protein YtfJ [Clostridia bacterium]
MSNPIKEMIEGAMSSVQGMIDTKSVIGTPITAPDGTIIVPVSKVSFGVGGGGSEFSAKSKEGENLFAGGIGSGATVQAEAFLVINNSNVRLIPMNASQSSLDKVIDLMPGVIDKVNGFISNRKKEKNTDEYNS